MLLGFSSSGALVSDFDLTLDLSAVVCFGFRASDFDSVASLRSVDPSFRRASFFVMNSAGEKRRIRRLDRFSQLLDSAFRIPGTDIRIGVDALLGLIPGVGDTLGAVLSSYIIFEAARLGLPKSILLRMIGNVAVELIVGAVPILGDVFDIAWKANVRNFTLLRAHAPVDTPKERSSRQIMRLFVWAMILTMIGLVALSIIMVRFLYQLLAS